MIITLKSTDENQAEHTITVGSGSKYVWKLQEAEYIEIAFSTYHSIPYNEFYYCNISGLGRFEVVTRSQAKRSTSHQGWDVRLRLDRPWARMAYRMLFFNRSTTSGMEANFTLSETLEKHVGVIIDNLKAIGLTYGGTDYKPVYHTGDIGKYGQRIVINHNNSDILSALYTVAKTYDCEVWFEDEKIHFGKCSSSQATLTLTEDVEVHDITRAEDSDPHGTRLYAYGSTRNLTADYRTKETGFAIQGVAETRLHLPLSDYRKGYIGSDNTLFTKEVVKVYEDIYPRCLLTVKTSETKTYDETDTTTGDKRTRTTNRITTRFTDGEQKDFIFKSAYLSKKSGETVMVHFETGQLAGMDFEVVWNPEVADESKKGEGDGAKVFELVLNTNYTLEFPNLNAQAKVGDKLFMYNIDISAVNDKLIPNAERELERVALEDFALMSRDSGTYTAPLNPVQIKGKKITFSYGRAVNLKSWTYFHHEPNIQRTTRIIGWELNLDDLTQGTLTIGESVAYNLLRSLRSDASGVTYQAMISNATQSTTDGSTAVGGEAVTTQDILVTQTCGYWKKDMIVPKGITFEKFITFLLHEAKGASVSASYSQKTDLEYGTKMGKITYTVTHNGNGPITAMTYNGTAQEKPRDDGKDFSIVRDLAQENPKNPYHVSNMTYTAVFNFDSKGDVKAKEEQANSIYVSVYKPWFAGVITGGKANAPQTSEEVRSKLTAYTPSQKSFSVGSWSVFCIAVPDGMKLKTLYDTQALGDYLEDTSLYEQKNIKVKAVGIGEEMSYILYTFFSSGTNNPTKFTFTT